MRDSRPRRRIAFREQLGWIGKIDTGGRRRRGLFGNGPDWPPPPPPPPVRGPWRWPGLPFDTDFWPHQATTGRRRMPTMPMVSSPAATSTCCPIQSPRFSHCAAGAAAAADARSTCAILTPPFPTCDQTEMLPMFSVWSATDRSIDRSIDGGNKISHCTVAAIAARARNHKRSHARIL